VYDAAGLAEALEDSALATAREALRAALVDVRWKRCRARDQEPLETTCNQPLRNTLREREVSVRIVRATAPKAPNASSPLGDALIDATGDAAFATVYFNRVVWLAVTAGTDLPTLLGRAIAHELGHLLLATPSHARTGLMRPNWTSDELRRNRAADWAFGRKTIDAIQARAR
jgi:hypothetical protein